MNDSYFKEPWAVAPFLDGYAVSDAANNVVRFIAHDKNKVQTATGQRAKGSMNGYGIEATFNRPTGLATDEAGNLYIADTGNNRIRKLTNIGTITTYLENLNEPTGLCWKNGSLYICESGANRILRAENGSVTVVAGSGVKHWQMAVRSRRSFIIRRVSQWRMTASFMYRIPETMQ